MSTKGIFTAVSGAMAQNSRLETIANNIANVNTPSFKKDSQIFKEYLASHERPSEVIQVPKNLAEPESFYNMQGADKGYVETDRSYTDFKQGSVKPTGNSLDFAIEGSGFFEVGTPQGVRLTRNGSFTVDGEGRLVTKDGFTVLQPGAPGTAAAGREIRLQPGGDLRVTKTGELFQGVNRVGALSFVSVSNLDGLQKVGTSNYKLLDTVPVVLTPATDSQIHQASLEMSNVNVIQEMTDMISATRTFESLQKAIQAYDQMNDKLVNTIPKL
ncbi:MAG: flagellar basal-body rod protein FlgF [Bdellovibrionales bacterium]